MLDWDPNDPDIVKVHYDVSGWSIDQRAELTEAFAEAEIAHVWDGDEVVVPEELEAQVDEVFARLEELLGPFPVALGADDPGVEFGLDEWPEADRRTLTEALVEAEVPHRWDGATVVVATDAESTVDELLDAIEQGTLVLGDTASRRPTAPWTRCSPPRTAWPRTPTTSTGREEISELAPRLDPAQPPYGVSVGSWAKTVEAPGRSPRWSSEGIAVGRHRRRPGRCARSSASTSLTAVGRAAGEPTR